MTIPLLDNIDPQRYPYPAADWSEGSQYTNHSDDTALWAWEFTRRRKDFQLLTDIKFATHNAQANSCAYTDTDADIDEKLAKFHERSKAIELLRTPQALVDLLKQYPEFDNELADAEERGHLSENHIYKIGFAHVVSRYVLVSIFPQFRESAGWRNARPWPDQPGVDRPNILNPEIHRANMPPWPVRWYGDNLVPDNDIQMDIAYLDATSIEAYTPKSVFYVNTDPESGNIEPPEKDDEVLRVLYGQAVGSVIDFGRRKEYRRIIKSDEKKAAQMAHIAFDLSAPLETQLDWTREILKDMRSRGEKARVIQSDQGIPKTPKHLGVDWLRYLDYEADPNKCSIGDFQQMLGWKYRDSTKWRRLKTNALKYRDDIGPKLNDYRGP